MLEIQKMFRIVMLTVAFPCLVSIIVYFGFGTNYTGGVFHESGFRSQYESGIYKYRVVGHHLLLATHRFVKSDTFVARYLRRTFAYPPAGAILLDLNIDPSFYIAYFVQNTIFMIISCMILYALLAHTPGVVSSLVVMLAALLMSVTQYVVCPYDTLSYALLLLSFLLITRPFRFSESILVATLVLSTLTRESAAITLSFFFAHHFTSLAKLSIRTLRQLSILVLVFIATYSLLRVFLGLEKAIWQDVRLAANLSSSHSVIGMLAMPIVSYLIITVCSNKKKCVTFLIASSPYWLAMPVIAQTWEIRLWVPIWLGLLCFPSGIPNKAVLPIAANTA